MKNCLHQITYQNSFTEFTHCYFTDYSLVTTEYRTETKSSIVNTLVTLVTPFKIIQNTKLTPQPNLHLIPVYHYQPWSSFFSLKS